MSREPERDARLSAELLELLGSADFMCLVENYGGIRLLVRAGSDNKLVDTLGAEVGAKLFDRYSGTYLRIPLAREFRARHYRQAGASNAEIARRLGVTETAIDKLFRRVREKDSTDPRQLKLFGT